MATGVGVGAGVASASAATPSVVLTTARRMIRRMEVAFGGRPGSSGAATGSIRHLFEICLGPRGQSAEDRLERWSGILLEDCAARMRTHGETE